MAKKRRDWETPVGSTAAGAGGATIVGGLAAGGIPKAKVDSIKLRHLTENPKVKQGTKRSRTKEFVRNIPKARLGYQGGVGGMRESAHYIVESTEAQKLHERGKTPLSGMSHSEAFHHGVGTGKIPAERVIMRQMKGLRHSGHKALGAGLVLTAGGAALAHGGKHKDLSKRDDRWRRTEMASGATLGAGVVGAGATAGGARVFDAQQRKWEGKARHNVAESGRLVPGLGTETKRSKNPRFKGALVPSENEAKALRDPKTFAGKTKETAMEAGRLRGEARQASYFGTVHRIHAKHARRVTKPMLAVAGLGAAGLGASKYAEHRAKLKKSYNPRMSAFGVEH
jgi:hypothetical protein